MPTAKVATEKPTEEDDLLKNGPINQRECRDILCCLIFIGAFCACLWFFAFGISNGQLSRLLAVYDRAGTPCGIDTQESRKYLFFYIPKSGMFDYATCVATCPTSIFDSTSDCDTAAIPAASCAKNNCGSISGVTSMDTTTVCYYETSTFLGRICAPTTTTLATFGAGAESSMNAIINTQTLTGWIKDISTAKYIIAASVGIAFFLGVFYLFFLRIFAGLIVWIALLAYFTALIILGILCYLKYKDISDYLITNSNVESGSNTDNNKMTYLYLSIIIWAFAFFCFIVFLCLYTKIRQAIAIIKTTSQFVNDVWSTMFVPPIFTLIVAGWWVMWIIGYVYLYSVDESGTIKKDAKYPFADVQHSTHVTRMLWAYFFVGLWVNAFIQAICQFVLASSACIWYFSHGENGQTHAPVGTSLYRAFRYHLGSLAFGSLILAIVQFIRAILAYMEYQMNKAGAQQNTAMKYLLRCLQCYLACFERFIKFLNRNAYIQVCRQAVISRTASPQMTYPPPVTQIALKGQNFCVAAKDALSVIWCNADRFALVNGIGGAFIFLGKLFIAISTTFVCYLIFTYREPYKSELNSYILPCLIILFIAYAISIIFMCVYGMGMQAILMCFLWDEKIYQTKVPPHAPALLQEFFQNQEKK